MATVYQSSGPGVDSVQWVYGDDRKVFVAAHRAGLPGPPGDLVVKLGGIGDPHVLGLAGEQIS